MKKYKWYKKSLWCGPDSGCSYCKVCRYLDSQDHATAVGYGYQRDPFLDDFLELLDKYPDYK